MKVVLFFSNHSAIGTLQHRVMNNQSWNTAASICSKLTISWRRAFRDRGVNTPYSILIPDPSADPACSCPGTLARNHHHLP